MTLKKDIFINALRTHHLSLTAARKQVYETLSANGALSMSSLMKLTTVNRSSIYRTVCLFEKIGIVHRVYTGWKYTVELSDLFDSHHHHASCIKCNKVINLIDDEELERSLGILSKKYNFTITAHQVELSGFCDTCQH